jgi:hypothetical protein
MNPVGCPETSVRNDNYILRNNPEERRSLLRRGEKPEILLKLFLNLTSPQGSEARLHLY